MRDATAEVIQQVVSGEVPVVNVEVQQTIENETNILLLIEERSPEPSINFSSSTPQELDEQQSKFARLDFPDEYLDLIHTSASHLAVEDYLAGNVTWLEEHMEDLNNHVIEKLTTIQQEVNRPYTIDDCGTSL